MKGKHRTPRRRLSAGVFVDEEQRRHLVRSCAFFRAQRFRDAAPDQVRRQDLDAAAAEIESAIAAPRRKKKR